MTAAVSTTDCFRLQLPNDISVTTDGAVPVITEPDAGKKLNQRKYTHAERMHQAK